jgi:hypothetical protein
MHHEDVERMTSDFLRFDSHNFADPVSGVNHEITGGKWNLFRSHVRLSPSIRLAPPGRLIRLSHPTAHDSTKSGDS